MYNLWHKLVCHFLLAFWHAAHYPSSRHGKKEESSLITWRTLWRWCVGSFIILLFQAHLICGSTEKADDIDELEIDEVTAASSDGLQQPGMENRKLLASKEIQRENEIPQRNACPIWTQGLERTFKVTNNFLPNLHSHKWGFSSRRHKLSIHQVCWGHFLEVKTFLVDRELHRESTQVENARDLSIHEH